MISKKVLVVDGEEVIRKLLRIHLAKLGYEVEEAADGAEALEQLGNEGFDFLILDILIPNEDGWQVLKDVKSNLKTKDIPIIILTAKNGDSDMIKGYAMGASYYITKPFTKAQLLYGLKLIFEENYESLPVARQQ
jgi:DNA-binding response OmpR family regulator